MRRQANLRVREKDGTPRVIAQTVVGIDDGPSKELEDECIEHELRKNEKERGCRICIEAYTCIFIPGAPGAVDGCHHDCRPVFACRGT